MIKMRKVLIRNIIKRRIEDTYEKLKKEYERNMRKTKNNQNEKNRIYKR